MEHTVLSSKQTRTRLGQYLVDIKYRPEHLFVIEKTGEDDYVGVLCSPQLLREKGIQIPTRPAKAKADAKDDKSKKKQTF